MAIKGLFESHHPLSPAFVRGSIILPRLNLQIRAKFMIDTGAIHSMIGHADILDAGLDYGLLKKDAMIEIGGFAGSLLCYREEAEVVLVDQNGHVYSFDIDIIIPPPGEAGKLPSVLARDILNRCEVKLNFNFGVVELVGPSRARISPTSG